MQRICMLKLIISADEAAAEAVVVVVMLFTLLHFSAFRQLSIPEQIAHSLSLSLSAHLFGTDL